MQCMPWTQDPRRAEALQGLDRSSRPDPELVRRLITRLDTDGSGVMAASEMRALVSKVSDVPLEEVDEGVSTVREYVGLSIEEATLKMCEIETHGQVDTHRNPCREGSHRP